MRPFRYERPSDVASAVTLGQSQGTMFMGGGTNLVDLMKLEVAIPDVVVDVSRLPLDRVESLPDGRVRVGATLRNGDLAADLIIRERYPVLAEALLAGASGQLRNQATTGGNLLQRTRCAYFLDVTTPCNKREPGSGCSAIGGWTRYHAILGASPQCVAVHPSDMAVALAALDAVVRVQSPDGERTIPVTELHRLPGDEPHRDTVLEQGEVITAIDLPALPAGVRSRYRKVRDRAAYAFALVSVAVCMRVEDRKVRDVRIAFGGLAHKPWRASRAEDLLLNGPAARDAFHDAAEAELAAAEPLQGNAFKVAMARNILVAALVELTGEEDQ